MPPLTSAEPFFQKPAVRYFQTILVNVQLGAYGAAQFPTVGTTTLPVPSYQLNAGCPASGGPTAVIGDLFGAAMRGDLALTRRRRIGRFH